VTWVSRQNEASIDPSESCAKIGDFSFTLVEVTRCRMLCSDSTCSPPWQATSQVATRSADGALPGSIDEGVGCWRIFDSIGRSHVDHHSRSDQTLRAN